MLGGLLAGLILGWILTLFGVDHMVLGVLQDFTTVALTTSHWYVALGIIGLLGGAFSKN